MCITKGRLHRARQGCVARHFEGAKKIAWPSFYFYYSSMNAGKSTTLLQSAHNYCERGLTPLLFTPQLDTRAGQGRIASRIGLETEARTLTPADDLHQLTVSAGTIDCVLVDEAQFLTRAQVYQLGEVADQQGVPVLAYGLRTDFQGNLLRVANSSLPGQTSLSRSKPSAIAAARRQWCCEPTKSVMSCVKASRLKSVATTATLLCAGNASRKGWPIRNLVTCRCSDRHHFTAHFPSDRR